MKKLLTLIIVLLFITGCGEDEVRHGDLSDLEEETKEVKIETLAEERIEDITPSKIEETVLFDEHGVKIVAKSLDFQAYGSLQVSLYIENNNEYDIKVDDLYFSINDIEIKATFLEYIGAYSTDNAHISIAKEDMLKRLISNVQKIEMNLVVKRDREVLFTTENLVLETDVKDYVQPIKSYGTLIYDQNDINLYIYKTQYDTYIGETKVFTNIYNASDKNIEIEVTDLKINDKVVDKPLYKAFVRKGKQLLTNFAIDADWLKENEISEIEKMEFKLVIYEQELATDTEGEPYKKLLYTSDLLSMTFTEDGKAEETPYSSYQELNKVFG